MTKDKLFYEKQLESQGMTVLAGMDEVGRGCLAGPVTVACVSLPLDSDSLICGIKDSKKLSEKARERLFGQIMEKATSCFISSIDCDEIDRINILNATKKAMVDCIENIGQVDCVLVDAVQLDKAKISTFPIVHGDDLSYLIAAASIVAKVTRDNFMKKEGKKYPHYNFEKNKGYGTKEHIEAIKKHGLSPIHRKTFVKNFYIPPQRAE